MEVQLYIKGNKIDLFDDEKISINLSVKNINDLSKVLTDFTQSFNIPCTKNNNLVFEHWYNADVDGTFNINIRIEAYLEVNSLPFRYGVLQLDGAKLKDGLPYSYSCTFFGATVSLSDLFGEDKLDVLNELNLYNHQYTKENVLNALSNDNLFNGDVYYPMINSIDEMSLQTGNSRDLINSGNLISYREFKPAIRNIKVIEAISKKYNIEFSNDFFDRAVFYNSFLWLNKESGFLKSFGNESKIDLQTPGNLLDIGILVNLFDDSISFVPDEVSVNAVLKRDFKIIIIPNIFDLNVLYRIKIYRNGTKVNEVEGFGIMELNWNEESSFLTNQNFYFTISASASFNYVSQISARRQIAVLNTGLVNIVDKGLINATTININSEIKITEQLPDIKIKDYFNSLISQFNLIIKPISYNNFYIDTLDSWYSKGVKYNLNKYIDIKDISVKRPSVKKKIEFLYEKTEAILGKKYFDNNQIGYGDLKVNYNISGEDLKIQSNFENMLFERLPKEIDGNLTNLQVGFSLDKDLNPYKGKPIIFYRNGIEVLQDNIFISQTSINKVWHTATEDNINIKQVTNSLNFGSDVSTYFYTPIEKGLYFNFWKTYIEDLYNKKSRSLSIKGNMPNNILYRLQLNDRFIIQDRSYKISDLKIDLTNGSFTGEVFTDFSLPVDTIDNEIPITVDTTNISVDNTNITVDAISNYEPIYSFINNGISINYYEATKGSEFFEVKITSNTNWSIQNIDNGNGVSWFRVNKNIGNKTDYIKVSIDYNLSNNRTGILRFTIGTEVFDLNIIQL